jgi:zinc protease
MTDRAMALTPKPAEIPATPAGVRLITLDNGLTLIIREDHSAPVVSAQAWCVAGSIDEGQWLGAGLSHVLEHMLFKGTSKRAGSRIDQEIQEAGGYMNAYTSFDRTVYWINVPNTGATTALDVLCDIVQNATLPPEEMAKEKQVILREMDMNQDDPSRRSSRRLFETAYTRSPYRYTVIGYPDIYNALEREDVLTYYRQKYAPNNLVFVVVGDFQAAAVEAQIREAFRGVKSRPLPARAIPEEPRQVAAREIIEEAPVELAHFHFAWHIPDIRHPDVPLLDVLSTLLGAGRSSRLFQQVREKKGLVHSVDSWTYSPGNTGLFGMSGVCEPGQFAAAREAMLEEVERMKTDGLTDAELRKAVKQFTAATLAARKTMQGQAQDLGGNWLAAGDLNFSERYLAAVKRIAPEDLRRVARSYLTTENRSLYALLPTGASARVADAASQTADNAIRKVVLPNGLILLLKEDHRLPFVNFRTVFKGGVLAETEENSGLTLLLSKMLLKGTSQRAAEQIATEFESLGGAIDSYGGNNSFGVNAEVMNADFDTGFEILTDVLLHPSWPEDALELEKQMQLASIRATRDQILQSGGQAMRRALFGTRSYGLDANGTETSVPNASVAALKAFYARMMVPNNCVLAIYGDIQPDLVIAAVNRALGHWRPGAPVLATLPATPPLNEVKRVVEFRDKKQAVVLLGFPGADLQNPDRYALELLQETCSDLGSRLFMRVRDKLGLAYYVGAQQFIGLAPGYFAFYAGTMPEKTAQVEAEFLREVANLRAHGITPEELKRSQAKIIGQKKIARQDLGGYAMTTAIDELCGLGYGNSDAEDARYLAVTLEQIQAAANRYLNPATMVAAIVRPEEAAAS